MNVPLLLPPSKVVKTGNYHYSRIGLDGDYLALGTNSQRVRVLELGRVVRDVKEVPDITDWQIGFGHIVGFHAGALHCWEFPSFEKVWIQEGLIAEQVFAIRSEGVIVWRDGFVVLINWKGRFSPLFPLASAPYLCTLGFYTTKGKRIFSASGDMLVGHDGTVHFLYQRDSLLLSFSAMDKTVRCWNYRLCTKIWRGKGVKLSGFVTCNDRWIFVGGVGGRAYLLDWRMATIQLDTRFGADIKQAVIGHDGWIYAVDDSGAIYCFNPTPGPSR
jgi:outer membrane protein assembly factor BamB